MTDLTIFVSVGYVEWIQHTMLARGESVFDSGASSPIPF
jgi:hypothetical protein